MSHTNQHSPYAQTAAQQAQQKNRDQGGRYAEKQHAEADFDLPGTGFYESMERFLNATDNDLAGVDIDTDFIDAAADQQAPLTTDELVAEFGQPTDADRADAVPLVRDGTSFMHTKFGWDALMGAKTRRTDKNAAVYHQRKEEAILADPEHADGYREAVEKQTLHLAEQRAHQRAWEAGVRTELDPYFDRIWDGETPGDSREDVEKSITRSRADLESVLAGTTPPSRIVGRGYRNAKKVAVEYLQGQVAEGERALATDGRSNALNINNARYRARQNAEGGEVQ